MQSWEQECMRLGIPFDRRPKEPASNAPKTEPFTKEGLLTHLVKFVSGGDQVRYTKFMLGKLLMITTSVNKRCR